MLHVRDQAGLERPQPATPLPLTADFTKDTMGEVWEDYGQQLVTALNSLRHLHHPKTAHHQQHQRDTGTVAGHLIEATMEQLADSRLYDVQEMKTVTRQKAELIYINNLYREENGELQMAGELAEVKMEALRAENTTFRRLIRGLENSGEDTRPLEEEIRCVRADLEERSRTVPQQKAQMVQLGEQMENLRDAIGNLNFDLSLKKTEIEEDECKIRQLTSSLSTLQHQVKMARQVSRQMNRQMRNKEVIIEELQWILAECLSSKQACQETHEDLMGQIVIVKNVKGTGVEDELSAGVFARRKAPSLAVELATTAVLLGEMREPGATRSCSQDCLHPWLRTLKSLITASPELLHHAGMLALGFMIPFCLMVVCLPACPGVHRPQCSELILRAVKTFIEPYCSMSYSAAPLH